MKVKASECFDKVIGSAYLITISQYAINSTAVEVGKRDDIDKNMRAAQIARSVFLASENISIVSGQLATFNATKKG